jgi:hypothetical protein
MATPKETKPLLVLGISYKEHKNSPPPGLKWVKLKKGDTFGTIADTYGVRPLDLFLYNWHSVKPFEINWYLKHYVGCRANNGRTYIFDGGENPGMLLVPDVPPSVANGPATVVDAVRNGKATSDSKIQVYVSEWVANGSSVPVSGKWVYVFSGSGGVDFGKKFEPGPPLLYNPEGLPRDPAGEPFSAFTLDFPGAFSIAEKADKLEYEIYVTSEEDPTPDLLAAVGVKEKASPGFKTGKNWYFLSDPTILKKATSNGRNSRTTHAFRGAASNGLVTIDLSKDHRYYFLLSPVQLGPEGIKAAMNNPDGMIPLLKPGLQTQLWSPDNPDGPSISTYVGPTAADIKKGRIRLGVIDPYAWAENLAEDVYAYSVTTYATWVSSKHNETLDELKENTGWDLPRYSLAKVLKTIRDSHAKPASIDSELKDAAKWKDDLQEWDRLLVEKNATINANVGRDLQQILKWMDGPGHRIIEAAILSDTSANQSQDAIDIARGLLHWSICTENLIAMEPGIAWLRETLSTLGNVAYNMLLKDLKDIGKDNFNWTPSPTQVKAFRYGQHGVLNLIALADFVTPKLDFSTFNRQEFLAAFAKYRDTRRKNLIKFFNDSQILPGKVEIPKGFTLTEISSSSATWSVGSTAAVSMLDMVDKWTTYVIDKDVNIPRDKGKVLNWLADLEVWFGKRPKFSKIANLGSSYVLKVVSLGLSTYNLYSTVTTARHDYQHSVSPTTWASAISGSTLAVQDALAEVGAIVEKRLGTAAISRVFPQLITTGGTAWRAVQITGIAGRVFAGVNVLAMVISGVTTMVSMGTSAAKSYRNGDYAAATFYGIGVLGGAMMVAGGLTLGYAMMTAGGAASATGVGATVGVVLFAIGGIIAGISALFAWWKSSDELQIFARKCFLGNQGDHEPRWGDDPPDWSMANKSSTDSWPIDMQRRGLFNLLGRFKVETKPAATYERGRKYYGDINFKVTPGYFPDGSSIEFALHEEDGQQTMAAFRWEAYNPAEPIPKTELLVNRTYGGMFNPDAMRCYFTVNDGQVKAAITRAPSIKYIDRGAALLATVTVHLGGETSTIRCRKLVMKEGKVYGVTIGDGEETSDIYK